jgi:hypothetical protein
MDRLRLATRGGYEERSSSTSLVGRPRGLAYSGEKKISLAGNKWVREL